MALGFHGRDAREYSRLIVHDRAYLLSKNFSPTRATLVRFWLLIGIFFAHRIVNREWKGVTGLCEGIAAARREGYLRPASREKPATEIASSPELS